MSINKPTKPTEQIADAFGGVKENFSSSLIESGYEDAQLQILGGANLNYLLDSLGKNIKYNNIISDFISGIPIAKTPIVNSSNKLDYTQFGVKVYNVAETYALGDWVIGNVDNAGRKIYESLINNNTGNALDGQYWEEVNLGKITSVAFRTIGGIIFSLTPLNDDSLKLLNGQVITAENIPEDFKTYITWLQTNAPQCFTTESDWQNQNATYGECGKYVYYSDTQSIRLPKITGIVQGTNTNTSLGSIIPAGLPNHTHNATINSAGSHTHTFSGNAMTGTGIPWRKQTNTDSQITGVFNRSATNTYYGLSSGDGSNYCINFYGVPSGSISSSGSHTHSISVNNGGGIGSSNTVQPQTVQGYYYVVFTNNAAEQEIEEIIGDKASKSYVNNQINELSTEISTTYATKQEVASIYRPAGSVLYANLPTLSATVLGNVYNITNSFTTDSRFVEGAGISVAAGTNVIVVDIGTSESPSYKFDLFSVSIDMTNYYTKSQVYNKSEVDTKLLEIESGNIDVSQQISSIVDNKLIEGTGIDFTSGLRTSTSVSSTNSGLTVSSSYSGTRPSAGRETYEFTYNGSAWEYNSSVVDLSTYYLTVTGTPSSNDKITLVYDTITTTTISTEFDGAYNSLSGKPSFATVATSGSYSDLSNKPTIPTVTSTYSSSGTDAVNGTAVSSAISTKEDIAKTVTTPSTSGTIALSDNTIYKLTPTGAITFTLPTITDLTKFHQILIQLNMSTVYSISTGLGATPHYFNEVAPDLSATGVYNLIYEYDNANGYWVLGALKKGVAS